MAAGILVWCHQQLNSKKNGILKKSKSKDNISNLTSNKF